MTQTIFHNRLDGSDLLNLENAASQLAAFANRAIDQYCDLCNEIKSLEAAGITNATPYYRDEKYLYLIHPTAPDGSRQREYIGADPTRQAAALDRIQRHAQHQELTARADRAANEIRQCTYQITCLSLTLKGI